MIPNILLWDLETSLMQVSTFSLYPQRIPHKNIIQDWYIISAAWTKLSSNRIHSVSGLDDQKRFKKNFTDDYHIVKTLRDVLEDVDVIIGHNQDKFDIKKFCARLIYHKLPPLPKLIHSIDTLKQIRKIAAFSSNRLDYLTTYLCGEGKLETSGGLWERALQGDVIAIKELAKYNKVDVKRLEELYLRIKPYIKSHPHLGAIAGEDRDCTCPYCGSNNMRHAGFRYTAAGIKKSQKQCNECHSYSTFNAEPL
jgi:hypothetical protein